MKFTSPEAYKLLHDGVQTLSQIEANGIAIDVEYLDRTLEEMGQQIKDLETRMRKSEVGRVWKREYHDKMNLGSGQQLGNVLFKKMGFKPTEETESGRYRTGASDIEALDHPFVKDYIELERLKKTRNTFLCGIKRETTSAGLAHVHFHLHTVSTYRSSSRNFNFQNLPIRNPLQGAAVRRCFIPRTEDRRLVELDYSGIEVSIAACYHKDPRMIEYILDPTKDMHRDMAAECFCLKPNQVDKMTRYCGKNMFVFPEFYGSFWLDCAENLWEALDLFDLKTKDETLVKKHLEELGMGKGRFHGRAESDFKNGPTVSYRNKAERLRKTKELLSQGYKEGGIHAKKGFYKHISDVQIRFWGQMFPQYASWKEKWYAAYQQQGWFETLTGFVIRGELGRNDVINWPVQGAAFHCLLKSLIELQRRLRKYKMDALIVGQIHDSILADVPDHEVETYLEIAHEVTTQWLRKQWDWIILPLEIEAEVTPLGGTWHDKVEWEL